MWFLPIKPGSAVVFLKGNSELVIKPKDGTGLPLKLYLAPSILPAPKNCANPLLNSLSCK